MTGTGISAFVYVILCFISPPPGMNRRFVEIDESKGEARFGHIAETGSQENYGEEGKDMAAFEGEGKGKLASQVTVLPA
jgi:NCS1 family nucleobase:cation symporter-1